MNWLWLNVPLMAIFFLAFAGIPLWLVLRREHYSSAPADTSGQLPVKVAARYHVPEVRAARRHSPVRLSGITSEDEAWMRELAGVGGR